MRSFFSFSVVVECWQHPLHVMTDERHPKCPYFLTHHPHYSVISQSKCLPRLSGVSWGSRQMGKPPPPPRTTQRGEVAGSAARSRQTLQTGQWWEMRLYITYDRDTDTYWYLKHLIFIHIEVNSIVIAGSHGSFVSGRLSLSKLLRETFWSEEKYRDWREHDE